MSDVYDRNQRCYPQIQTGFDVIPNTAGAATVANADCCLITDLKTEARQSEIPRPDKTGSLDQILAQAGRRIASFSASMSMAGNGTAGTAPDCKNFLQGIFGGAGVVVPATSVTYSLADLLYYLSIWNFVSPANATSMVAFNCLIQKMEAAFGGDVPTLTFSGEAGWVLDNDQFADGTTLTAAKGGLTSWPTEPAAPVVNGTHPPGFKLTATIDGQAYTNVYSGKASLSVMRELLKEGNSEFAGAGAVGDRLVTLDWSMADTDSASLRTLKQKSYSRTPIDITFQVGTVAGNRWGYICKNIIVPKPTYSKQGNRRAVNFSNAVAYPSSITAKDQFALALT